MMNFWPTFTDISIACPPSMYFSMFFRESYPQSVNSATSLNPASFRSFRMTSRLLESGMFPGKVR